MKGDAAVDEWVMETKDGVAGAAATALCMGGRK